MIEETAEEMRIRIESRDERMKADLAENYSGRTWFGQVDVFKEGCKWIYQTERLNSS